MWSLKLRELKKILRIWYYLLNLEKTPLSFFKKHYKYKLRSSILGSFCRVFCDGLFSSIHSYINIHMFCRLHSFVPLQSYLTLQTESTETGTGVKPCDLESLGEWPMKGRMFLGGDITKKNTMVLPRFTVTINWLVPMRGGKLEVNG